MFKESRRQWFLGAGALGLLALGLGSLMSPAEGPEPRAREELLNSSGRSALRITPDPPQTFHALQVTGDAAQAALGNQVQGSVSGSVEVVWSVNGQERARGHQLDPKFFHRGDRITARVESREVGGATTVHGTAESRVVNTRPQVRSATIQRDRNDPTWLRAHVRVMDADDDPLTLEFKWKADGRELSSPEGDRLLTTGLKTGARVGFEVVASDGALRSDPLAAEPIRLDNQPPRIDSQATPRTERNDSGELVASMPLTVSDPDGDPVEVHLSNAPAGFRWDAIGQAVVWTVVSGEDVVELTVEATDGRGARATRTYSVRR